MLVWPEQIKFTYCFGVFVLCRTWQKT